MELIPQTSEGLAKLFPCDWKGCKETAEHEIFFTQQPDIRRAVCKKHLASSQSQGFWQETQESKGEWD